MADVILKYIVNHENEIKISNISYTERQFSYHEIDESEFETVLLNSLKENDFIKNTLNLALLNIDVQSYRNYEGEYDINIYFEFISTVVLKENYESILKYELMEDLKYCLAIVKREHKEVNFETICDVVGHSLEKYENVFGILFDDNDAFVEAVINDKVSELPYFKEFKSKKFIF